MRVVSEGGSFEEGWFEGRASRRRSGGWPSDGGCLTCGAERGYGGKGGRGRGGGMGGVGGGRWRGKRGEGEGWLGGGWLG